MATIAGDSPENPDASGLDGEIITDKSALRRAFPALLIIGALVIVQFVSTGSRAQPITPARNGTTSAAREVTPSAVAVVSTPAPTAVQVVSSSTPSDAPRVNATLPAPLYYLGSDRQIWRYEADGGGVKQITQESRPVAAFDVSPADGALAYIVLDQDGAPSADVTPTPGTGTLMRSLADGSGRSAMAIGVQPARIAFSPDGAQLAFARNGIELMPVLGDEPSRTMIVDEVITDSLESTYSVQGWSPDGQTLLVAHQEAGASRVATLAVKVDDGTTVAFGSTGRCSHAAWEGDASAVYCDGTAFPNGWPGLYRVDPVTGQETTILGGTRPAGATDPFAFVAFPRPVDSGMLYALTNLHGTDPDPRYSLSRIHVGESVSTTVEIIGATVFRRPLEVLWTSDAAGVVVSSLEDMPAKEEPLVGELQWVALAGGTPQALTDDRGTPLLGANLRWGR